MVSSYDDFGFFEKAATAFVGEVALLAVRTCSSLSKTYILEHSPHSLLQVVMMW